ncbi:MAG: hypothetical protein AAGK01_07425, partial [Pseudomonadota bacterium]
PAPPIPITVIRGRISSVAAGPILMLISYSSRRGFGHLLRLVVCDTIVMRRLSRATPYPQWVVYYNLRPNGQKY